MQQRDRDSDRDSDGDGDGDGAGAGNASGRGGRATGSTSTSTGLGDGERTGGVRRSGGRRRRRRGGGARRWRWRWRRRRRRRRRRQGEGTRGQSIRSGEEILTGRFVANQSEFPAAVHLLVILSEVTARQQCVKSHKWPNGEETERRKSPPSAAANKERTRENPPKGVVVKYVGDHQPLFRHTALPRLADAHRGGKKQRDEHRNENATEDKRTTAAKVAVQRLRGQGKRNGNQKK